MTRVRQIPALLLAILMALALGFVPAPLRLLAAPVAQDSEPAMKGYYQSDVIPGQGDTPDLVVGLILYEDGTAKVISDYQDDSDVITEVGTWVDNGDDTLTLTVTGTTEGDYAAPIPLDFQIASDGSLVVPGDVNGAFGEAGLTLVPTAFGNSDAILAQIPSNALVYQSDVMTSTTSAGLQLTLALFEDGSLTLVSDYMTAGDVVVEIGTWTQGDDGSLNVSLTGQIEDGNGQVTEYDAPLEFVFTVNDDNSLALVDEGGALFGEQGLTLVPTSATGEASTDETAATVAEGEAGAEATLEASEAITTETGTAQATPEATEAAGEATAEATPEATTEATTEVEKTPVAEATPEAGDETTTDESDTEEANTEESTGAETISETGAITPSGAYVSSVLPAEDNGGNFLVMLFNEDGSLYFTTYTLNGDAPLVEVGTWAVNEDGSYSATVTGTVDDAYDAPIEVGFSVDAEGVINIADVNLYPLANIDLEGTPTLVAEFRSDLITDTVDATHTLTLVFYEDSTAELTRAYEKGEADTKYGEWMVNEAGDAITVTLTHDDNGDLAAPEEWLFEIGSDETLLLTNDNGYYGDDGLTLTAVNVEDQSALEEEGSKTTGGETKSGDVESGEEITSSEEVTGTEEISDTEETTSSEAIQIFQSEVLPAASSPGLQLTLGLQDDGSAAIDYDYMNDEDVVTNTGEWVQNDDGTLTVTLTDGPNGELDLPVELTLELDDDGNLVVTDASEESLGLVDVVLAPVTEE